MLLLISVLYTGCKQPAEKKVIVSKNLLIDSINASPHNSFNSLNWNGTYKGELPCADCEGIKTEITLYTDKTFLIKVNYLGKDEKVLEEKGGFLWNSEGNTITLSGLKNKPNQYFIAENILLQLDMSGNKITGNLADKYILLKQ